MDSRLSSMLRRSFIRPFTSHSCLPPTIKQILSANSDHRQYDHDAPTTVHGWIKSVRRQKNVSFAVVNDGTTLKGLQAVFLHPESTQTFPPRGLNTGTSVRLAGKLIESTGKGQEKELVVEKVEILGECNLETYPIQKKVHSVEFFRENAHLRARTDSIAAMLRVRDKLAHAFGDWFEKEGFVYAHAPVMTSNDCEGAGEAFCVVSDTSNPPSTASQSQDSWPIPSPSTTYLTTSTQLHLEALTSALARVYTIAPSFRAERSQTNRHLNEFWMLEAEMSFLRPGVDGVCAVIESSLKRVLGTLTEDEDVKFLRASIPPTSDVGPDDWKAWLEPSMRWRRVTYTDALKALQAHHASGAQPRFTFSPPEWGGALRSEHERWITEWLDEDAEGVRHSSPVFVTDYPRQLKPFYMWVNDQEAEMRRTVACFDLLVPKLGELSGGSVRETRLEKLKESLAFHGMDESQHSWYIDLRRYGTSPHGGFGLGFERLLSWFCGIENVRECVAFPRWAGRILL